MARGLVGLPTRGLIRELALTCGGIGLLLSVAIRGELDTTAAVTIGLALLGAGPGASVGERVVHHLEPQRVSDLLEGLEDDQGRDADQPPPPARRRRPPRGGS